MRTLSPKPAPIASLSGGRAWLRLILSCVAVLCACSMAAFAQEEPAEEPAEDRILGDIGESDEPPVEPDPATQEVEEADREDSRVDQNFEPPEATAEAVEKPLITAAEYKEISDRLFKARMRERLRRGELTPENQKYIDEWARAAVHNLTRVEPEVREQLGRLREDIDSDIDGAASLQSAPDQARRFREYLLESVTKRLTELLDATFPVRMQAVVLLAELNYREQDRIRQTPVVPYSGAAEPLLKVLSAPPDPTLTRDENTSLRIIATNGLARIMQFANPSPDLKIRFGNAAIEQLQDNTTHPWYQRSLVDALVVVDQMLNLNREPFLVQALTMVLADDKRHWVVRSAAARALGRVPVDATINMPLLAYQIVKLAGQMAEAYNQNPAEVFWPECFWNVYLAFKPENAEELQRQAGLVTKSQAATLGDHAAVIESAYNRIVPLTSSVINQPGAPIPPEAINSINQWLQQNKPQNNRVAPGLQPIAQRGAGAP